MEKTIVKMVFGSYLYGLQTEDSDMDYAGVFIPPFRDILLNRVKDSYRKSTGGDSVRNTKDDVDLTMHSLNKFIAMACVGDTMAIDMLHCNKPFVTTEVWNVLVSNRQRFYIKNMSAYIGYVKRQAAKYGTKGSRLDAAMKVRDALAERVNKDYSLAFIWDKLPEGPYIEKPELDSMENLHLQYYEVLGKKYAANLKVDYVLKQVQNIIDKYGERAEMARRNEGVDWKALSHAVRCAYQMISIYTEGDFEYPLKETDLILKIKKGEMHATEVLDTIAYLSDQVEELSKKSDLPESADRDFWDDFIVSVYAGEFGFDLESVR